MTAVTTRSRAWAEHLVTGLLCAIMAVNAYWRYFDHDEFEHVHSAWYVSQGLVPYRDFFQHHHPLLWALLAPVLAIGGEHARTLVAARMLMAGLAAAIVASAVWIAREAGLPASTRRLTAVLVASQVVWMQTALEIRPDVPQVLAGLAAVALLLRSARTGSRRPLMLAGACGAVSFLFIQKAVWLFAAVAALLAARLGPRLPARAVRVLALSASLPLGAFFVWAAAVVGPSRYLQTNWFSNAAMTTTWAAPDVFLHSIVHNTVFWIAAGLACWRFGWRGRTRESLVWTTRLAAVLLIPLAIDRRPNTHDLLMPLALLAVPAAHFAAGVMRLPRRGRVIRRAFVPAAVAVVVVWGCLTARVTNRLQLDRAQYVIDRTSPSDVVYDVGSSFNLFRPDADYCWFALGPGAAATTYLARTQPGRVFDPYAVIAATSPAFIADDLVDASNLSLSARYAPTPYASLFRRKTASGARRDRESSP